MQVRILTEFSMDEYEGRKDVKFLPDEVVVSKEYGQSFVDKGLAIAVTGGSAAAKENEEETEQVVDKPVRNPSRPT